MDVRGWYQYQRLSFCWQNRRSAPVFFLGSALVKKTWGNWIIDTLPSPFLCRKSRWRCFSAVIWWKLLFFLSRVDRSLKSNPKMENPEIFFSILLHKFLYRFIQVKLLSLRVILVLWFSQSIKTMCRPNIPSRSRLLLKWHFWCFSFLLKYELVL